MTEAWKAVFGRLLGVGSLEKKKGASMKLIAGLGNPGSKYDDTRHNVGFMVVDALAQRFGATVRRKKFNALTEEVHAEETKLLLLKPQQYMNRSGHAVATAAGFYKLTPAEVLVVTDDMALDVGRLRLRAKGSAGGHNGLKDIEAQLGTNKYDRLRFGVGADFPKGRQVEFVLGKWDAKEEVEVEIQKDRACKAIEAWIHKGLVGAMNEFN